jgi:hypothetical protein
MTELRSGDDLDLGDRHRAVSAAREIDVDDVDDETVAGA